MNFVTATTEVEAGKWCDIYANSTQELANLLSVAVLLGHVQGILRSLIITQRRSAAPLMTAIM